MQLPDANAIALWIGHAAGDEDASSLMHEMGLASRFQLGKLKGVERWDPGLKKTTTPTKLIHLDRPSTWL